MARIAILVNKRGYTTQPSEGRSCILRQLVTNGKLYTQEEILIIFVSILMA